jgi:Ala-tRNA(Pro) deacylase
MRTITPATIRRHLDGLGIAYRHLTHAETRTSAESAAVRGEPLANGAKALVMKVGEEFLALTGLVPGSVPPFGEPILPLKLYVDEHVPSLERVAFNAASLTESIIMSAADYIRAAAPTEIFRFSSH